MAASPRADNSKHFLFSPSTLRANPPQLDPVFNVRPLRIDDYNKGFMPLLGQLTVAGQVTKDDFEERFKKLQKDGNYYVVVIEDTSKKQVVASATVFVEYKFLRGCGKVGHIEDVVTNETYRGKHLGQTVIEQLKHIAFSKGCYKVILDCAEKNVQFYKRCGFEVKELEMVVYAPTSGPKL